MARKVGVRGLPKYTIAVLFLWITNCPAWPVQLVTPIVNSGKENLTGSFTTVNPLPVRKVTRTINAAAATFAQRNKRDSNSKISFELFPSDVQSADDAVQKLMSLFASTRPKITVGIEDDYTGIDDPPIDIFAKRPGSMRTAWGSGSTSKNNKNIENGNGEEPTGPPIVLYKHRMTKKSPHQVIPEIFLRDAATSLRTQPDPKIMRNLIERIVLNRQASASSRNNDDDIAPFYSLGQLHEQSLKMEDGTSAVSR